VPPGTKHLVVIGASAGGIEALRLLVAGLRADFPASICVVLHVGPETPGILHEILSRSGSLPAVIARNGDRLLPGRIYVAPPDHHIVVEPEIVRTTRGPRENRFRPAIDPLFRSAAQVYGPSAIGVILTGNLDDGTAGLWAIKRLGGTAIVQDPEDALFPAMPESALAHVKPDYCVPLEQLAPLLVRLTAEPVPELEPPVVPREMEIELDIVKENDPLDAGIERLGTPSKCACPECHGVLLQVKEAGRIRFRCHTGHAYSAESLLADINASIETAMWNAIRALQEGNLFIRQMAAHHAEAAHSGGMTERLRERADELRRHAEALREMVTSPEPVAPSKQ
jgi:two-component system chemotaxis response regulator CheB